MRTRRRNRWRRSLITVLLPQLSLMGRRLRRRKRRMGNRAMHLHLLRKRSKTITRLAASIYE